MKNTGSQNTTPITGSIKDKIVASDLLEERLKRNFDMQEMNITLLGGRKKYDEVMAFFKFAESDPILRNSEKFNDMTREEQMACLL